MHGKLAGGHLPLSEMIALQIESAQQKIASAKNESSTETTTTKVAAAKEKKASAPAPTSVIAHDDPSEVQKLASALDHVGELFLKSAADSVDNGGESKQGGEQLPTSKPVGGKQSYGKDGSKKHQGTAHGTMSTKDNPGPATAMQTDDGRAPGGTGAKMPPNVLRKTAADSVRERIQKTAALPSAFAANAQKVQAAQNPAKPGAEKPDLGAKGKKDEDEKDEKKDKKDEDKKKESSADDVDYILNKMAEITGGGEVLTDDKVKAPVPSNPGRELISSNAAPAKATKAQAKTPVKKQLSEVLTEPAMSKSTDKKVHENLQNATKGGVKIAAARVLLQKIAEEGCKCPKDAPGTCQYCKMKKSMEKKSSSMSPTL